jgi:hypothetical protein
VHREVTGGQDGRSFPDRSRATRDAFAASVDGFLGTASRIGDGWWGRPATDSWTVLELFAHVVRGMAVISDYLDADLTPPDTVLPDAAAYFRAALDLDGVHTGIADRAAAAVAGAGDDPSAWARDVSQAAIRRVAETDGDRVLVHFAGATRFLDYLETRPTGRRRHRERDPARSRGPGRSPGPGPVGPTGPPGLQRARLTGRGRSRRPSPAVRWPPGPTGEVRPCSSP